MTGTSGDVGRSAEAAADPAAAGPADWTSVGAWYDVLNPWGRDNDFYLSLVMQAGRVLDVGCGTGQLLHRASDGGHEGRLCGLDPDPEVLALARRHSGIEWVLGDAASARFDREFDLATMTGHAFQELTDDDDLRQSLAAIRAALADGGRFAFESRHPQARAWEGWHGSSEHRGPDGDPVVVSYAVQDVTDGVVTVTETLAGQWWPEPQTGLGRLRFLDQAAITSFLQASGFAVEEQFGDWQRAPLTSASREIITIARRA
ncbi:MAG TPA: class I SAM-dependent methyltransferase [Streptosporangiaceae bacterium]